MTVPSENAQVIHLAEENDGDLKVMLEDKGRNVSPRTVTELIRACRAADHAGECYQQFNDLLEQLNQWVEQYRSRLRSASLAIRNSDLLFLVVQRETHFDEELSELLTDLDLELSRSDRFDMLRVNTLALPRCPREDVEQFFGIGYSEVGQ
ncbi:MAG: hypothetical protein WD049_06025 [Candidatus Paceibacterota bacterium]